mmetsp:Transcript_26445/g.26696  ORF Transcript_26445/g.26696 Transcript_26445/m.26696 type:complete len:113 (+) Transcript_26445:63-401(+)
MAYSSVFVFLLIISLAQGFPCRVQRGLTRTIAAPNQISHKGSFVFRANSPQAESSSVDGGFKKYECESCAYVYDEAKGFKKRIPPGTKWDSMSTFMCPVCGAAKNQFKLVEE